MSTSFVSQMAGRLRSVDWEGDWERSRSRVRLMQEFLRRSALWARELDSEDWPFFDVAALVEPSVRAESQTVERAVARAGAHQPVVGDTCAWALHFAALRDADVRLPELPDPFEPLVRMYERGGAFVLDGTGSAQVDAAALPLMTRDQRLVQSALSLTDVELDALDGR